MKIIGVTGGIGAGKSTVSRILYDLGAKLIDADIISKKIVRKGEEAYDELLEYFGREILNEKGIIDRKKLADIVFKDNVKREALNAITHKYVAREILNKMENFKRDEVEIAVLDVPIPVKKGFLDIVDEVWVVIADMETRIQRIQKRDKTVREKALERINAQMSNEDYIKLADRIIENNDGIQELEKLIARMFVEQKTR